MIFFKGVWMQTRYFLSLFISLTVLLATSLSATILDDFMHKIDSRSHPVQHRKKYRHHRKLSDAAQWQTALQFLGYYKGKVDGDLYTRSTFDAVTLFHFKHGEVDVGFLEEEDKKYLSEVYRILELNRYVSYEGKVKRKNNQKLQAALALHSFYTGKIDGQFGTESKNAFDRYKAAFAERTEHRTDAEIEKSLLANARSMSKKALERVKKDCFDPEKYTDHSKETDSLSELFL